MAIKARCGRADKLQPGASKVVQINESMVAIFNLNGEYFAIDNTCPHQGGPLGEGYLEESGVVTCPWHAWNFDIRTGVSPVDPDVKVRCYPVHIEEGEIILEMD